MTPNFLIFNTMTKQELLDYVSEKYNGWDNRKFVGKLKRIIAENIFFMVIRNSKVIRKE